MLEELRHRHGRPLQSTSLRELTSGRTQVGGVAHTVAGVGFAELGCGRQSVLPATHCAATPGQTRRGLLGTPSFGSATSNCLQGRRTCGGQLVQRPSESEVADKSRQPSRKVYPGDSNGLRSCPQFAQKLPRVCSGGRESARFRRNMPELGHVVCHALSSFDEVRPKPRRCCQKKGSILANIDQCWPKWVFGRFGPNLGSSWSNLANIRACSAVCIASFNQVVDVQHHVADDCLTWPESSEDALVVGVLPLSHLEEHARQGHA